jgi:hypothetical protein
MLLTVMVKSLRNLVVEATTLPPIFLTPTNPSLVKLKSRVMLPMLAIFSSHSSPILHSKDDCRILS